MGKTRIRNNSILCLLLMLIILCFSFISTSGSVNAKAETPEPQPITAQEIVDNAMFNSFRKGDNANYGKFIFACFYIPEAFYDTSCKYGVLIFPSNYMDRFITERDYIREFEEQAVQIMIIENDTPLEAPEGRLFKCGIVQMLEQNLGREFVFIFYAEDTLGNIAYTDPERATYNTLDAQNFTDAELLEILDRKLQMKDNFVTIIDKIEELVDSVWVYMVMVCASVVVVWGAYIGIRIAVAKRNEGKINAMGMVKSLIIGIVIMFVLAMGLPMLIHGLGKWIV